MNDSKRREFWIEDTGSWCPECGSTNVYEGENLHVKDSKVVHSIELQPQERIFSRDEIAVAMNKLYGFADVHFLNELFATGEK